MKTKNGTIMICIVLYVYGICHMQCVDAVTG